jgi:polyprenyl P-hydroxybenzoate/phenylacrylic acid decarboxylase-like protein
MSERSSDLPVLVAMTGATGAIYGIRLLEVLRELDVETHLVVSRWAEATIKTETDRRVDDVRALATVVYDEDDLAAPPASSAFATVGMVVAPCSMRTLAAVAIGLSDNLVQRAAAVHLQEGRKLLLLARESPLSVIHLENMLRVAKAGAVVAPPVPAFYAKLHSLDEMVDHTVGRALDQLGVEHERIRRWGERRTVLRALEPDDA